MAPITSQAETGLFFDVAQRNQIRSLSATGRATAERPQTACADTYNVAQAGGRKIGAVFLDKPKSHCFRPAKNWVAFFNTSLLSYPTCGSCAIREPVPGTAFMPGTGEGWIVSLLVVMDRGGVRSPSSFLMT